MIIIIITYPKPVSQTKDSYSKVIMLSSQRLFQLNEITGY